MAAQASSEAVSSLNADSRSACRGAAAAAEAGPITSALCDADCVSKFGVRTVTKSGLEYIDIVQGGGAKPVKGYQVAVNYVAMNEAGKAFDSSIEKGFPYDIRCAPAAVALAAALANETRNHRCQKPNKQPCILCWISCLSHRRNSVIAIFQPEQMMPQLLKCLWYSKARQAAPVLDPSNEGVWPENMQKRQAHDLSQATHTSRLHQNLPSAGLARKP